MKCFVDTSAFFALLDADDGNHLAAKSALAKLLDDDAGLRSDMSNSPLQNSTAWELPHCFPLHGATLAWLIV